MKVYVDSDFKCHISDDGELREIETDFFDGKCQRFIEGYRFVPSGETWVNPDGVSFAGEMVAPWKNYELLAETQAQYEESQAIIAELEAVNADLQAETDAMLVDYEYRLTLMELGLTEE